MELLANILRPEKLSDVIGQSHLVGNGKVISNLIHNKVLFSVILYGPPGTGKTSIASAIVHELNMTYRTLNAVVNKKEDFDIVIEEAKMNGSMILVIDEIHRMNKDKQDILLPYLESGLITIIGLTTSNPYHSINPAIRSRCQIFELLPLSTNDIIIGLKKGIQKLEDITIDDDTIKAIASYSNGDLRSALNLLEVCYYSTSDKKVTKEVVTSVNGKVPLFADKNDSGYYDTISAFQKSIRGSDVDAALYYLAVLLEAGDLDIIFRRMSVIAYEDIGLANPGIGPKVKACIDTCEMLGLPEARIPLSVLVTEMALSPKSNSAMLAIDKALSDIESGKGGKLPLHLKNTYSFDPSQKSYLYPHEYENAWVYQQYLPDTLKDAKYYFPKDSSKIETGLKERYLQINKWKQESEKNNKIK